MKNLFFTALLALGLTTSAFATDENKISILTRETFNSEYKGAEEVEWSVKPDYVKATFTVEGERLHVFYDKRGTKIGSSHHVALEDLPLSARRIIAKKYPNYNITEALVFNGVDEDSFYLSAENGSEKVILKINDASTVSTFKKTRKDIFW